MNPSRHRDVFLPGVECIPLATPERLADVAGQGGVKEDDPMTRLGRREFNQALVGAACAGLAEGSASVVDAQNGTAEKPSGSLTDVPGIRVGHFTDTRRPTGCTAILFDPEASAGVDYDGSAPGSHLGVMLQPMSSVERIHAILLTGGGLFGLAATEGVTRYLEERKIGHDWGTPGIRIPIVVGAVISDLDVGDGHIRPDAEAAYKACIAASVDPVKQGNLGAGAGATVGTMLWEQGLGGMKSGLGTASLRVGDLVVGALVVINGVGDIIDWRTGKIIAGARRTDGKGFVNIVETLKQLPPGQRAGAISLYDTSPRATNLLVVATNAVFNRRSLCNLAMMAATGAARTINPYHTDDDGDSAFAISTNKVRSDLSTSVVGSLAAEVVSEAVVRAIKEATSVEGWPAYRDFTTKLT
jgi:L-aminopeptidase/D-esterase-like protein